MVSSSCRKEPRMSFDETNERKLSLIQGESEDTEHMRLKRTTILTGNFGKKQETTD